MSSSAITKEVRKRGQDRFLLETVICDLHGTCLQLGAMTAIASSSLDALARRVPPAWRHFALNDTAVMLFALRFSSQMELPEPVKEAIRNLYIDLGTFKSQLLAAVERGTKTDDGGRPVVVRLAARARDLCREAALVLRMSEPCVHARLAPLLVAEDRRVAERRAALDLGARGARRAAPVPALRGRLRVRHRDGRGVRGRDGLARPGAARALVRAGRRRATERSSTTGTGGAVVDRRDPPMEQSSTSGSSGGAVVDHRDPPMEQSPMGRTCRVPPASERSERSRSTFSLRRAIARSRRDR